MSSESGEKKAVVNRGTKPPENQALGCPRCQSTNTKFCYYNNYNLSQPRYFCKSCRRYWTHGGTLRNIPVGGGTRKSSAVKRSRPTTTPVLSSTLTHHHPTTGSNQELEHQHQVINNLNLDQTVGESVGTRQQVEEEFAGFSGSGIFGLGFQLSPWDWSVGVGAGGESGSGYNTWQVESGLGDDDEDRYGG